MTNSVICGNPYDYAQLELTHIILQFEYLLKS